MSNERKALSFRIERSRFEAAWANGPPGHRLVAKRVGRYDRSSELVYAPIQFEYVPLTGVTDEPPSLDWSGRAFVEFVRGEFGTSHSRGQFPGELRLPKARLAPERVIFNYLENCERELVYSGLVRGLSKGAGPEMEGQIYAILTNRLLGNGRNAKSFSLDDFRTKVRPLIEEHKRLQFVLPAFPFKDQNMFRTQAPPTHVDMGELALLVRLHVLALAMYQVHPFGADWVIVTDGFAYAPIFNISNDDVALYRQTLLEYRSSLSIYYTVSIIDLKDMVNRLSSPQAGQRIFEATRAHITNQLRELSGESEEIAQTLSVLTRGMKWNVNYKDIPISWEEHWAILNSEIVDEIPKSLRSTWEAFQERASKAALEYASFNLALRYHEVFRRFLPESIRATIHPKPGQVAVPTLGDIYPWNGVALVKDEAFGPFSIDVRPLYKAIVEHPDLTPYCTSPGAPPFYYAHG